MLNFYNFSFLQSLWWICFLFGKNRHKILKCFRKETRNFKQATLSFNRSYLSPALPNESVFLYNSTVVQEKLTTSIFKDGENHLKMLHFFPNFYFIYSCMCIKCILVINWTFSALNFTFMKFSNGSWNIIFYTLSKLVVSQFQIFLLPKSAWWQNEVWPCTGCWWSQVSFCNTIILSI